MQLLGKCLAFVMGTIFATGKVVSSQCIQAHAFLGIFGAAVDLFGSALIFLRYLCLGLLLALFLRASACTKLEYFQGKCDHRNAGGDPKDDEGRENVAETEGLVTANLGSGPKSSLRSIFRCYVCFHLEINSSVQPPCNGDIQVSLK